MFFDAVVDKNYQPIYNSTPENVATWLKENKPENDWLVMTGRSLDAMTVAEYLKLEN